MTSASRIRLDAPSPLRTRVGWKLPDVAFALTLHPASVDSSLVIDVSGATLDLIDGLHPVQPSVRAATTAEAAIFAEHGQPVSDLLVMTITQAINA